MPILAEWKYNWLFAAMSIMAVKSRDQFPVSFIFVFLHLDSSARWNSTAESKRADISRETVPNIRHIITNTAPKNSSPQHRPRMTPYPDVAAHWTAGSTSSVTWANSRAHHHHVPITSQSYDHLSAWLYKLRCAGSSANSQQAMTVSVSHQRSKRGGW